jgi:transcriptional regulator with XRE-family HTH domain
MKARIRVARRKVGMTQVDFASAVGVRPKAVQDWEAGRLEPRVAQLRTLVEVTGFSADWFLADDEELEEEAVAVA